MKPEYYTQRRRLYWVRWLLKNLTWTSEPGPNIPRAFPIRRPILRLR